MPRLPHPFTECWDLRAAGLANERGDDKSAVRGCPSAAPSAASSPGPRSRFRPESTLARCILLCLIFCLVITALMNITVLLSHLLKKYS